MEKLIKTLGLMGLTLFFSSTSPAAVVVNFSPDATGASVTFSTLSNTIGNGQIIGDQFTLATGVFLTGGSIYSNSTQGPLGTQVHFLVYSNPVGAPLLDLTTTIDTVDTSGTTTQSILTRKHATIPSTFLAAGTYWFSLPSTLNVIYTAASGNFADNSLRQGSYASGLTTPVANGSAFFQLEGTAAVPEPGTGLLVAFGLGAFALGRRPRSRSAAS